MNRVLKYLTLSDLFLIGAFGLVSPIFALFLENDIQGATIAAIGIASGIYLIVKSVLQLWVSKYTDKDTGNRREFWTMLIGTIIIVITPLFYIVATDIWHIYLIQAFYGIGGALSFPGWMTIFTKFIDKKREGFEWSLYDTIINLGAAGTATIGGYLAESFGFEKLFFLIFVICLIGGSFLFFIRHQVIDKRK